MPEQQAPEPAAVAPVPEAMLETVRDVVMPRAQNLHCLNSNVWLGCFFADYSMRDVWRLEGTLPALLKGKLDLTAIAEKLNDDAEEAEDKTDVDAALNEPEPAAKPEKLEKKPAREKTEVHDKKKPSAKHDEKKPAHKSEDAF